MLERAAYRGLWRLQLFLKLECSFKVFSLTCAIFVPIIRTVQCLTELEAEHVECTDLSDGSCDGAKIELLVVSKKFDGVPLLKRHQMVNNLFAVELSSNQIHALTMKTWTPKQYAAKK